MNGAFRRWQIGAVRVSQVVESRGASPPSFFFPGTTPEQVQHHAWLRPLFAHADGRLFASIHCFVVESQGRRIVVDTCVGNDKPRREPFWHLQQRSFLADLAAAGFTPETIDTVLCTHMHVDHVGWNTRLEGGRWVPTFPHARYLFGCGEYAHWQASTDAEDRAIQTDSVQPIVDAGLADWVVPDHAITDEVGLMPTPGHTPGHVSVRIASQGQHAVITGDLMHHPVQCCEPDWAAAYDVDPAQARQTRREFLRRHADRPVLVLGTHFPQPSAGWVVSAGEVWRLTVEPPEAPC